jgi:predicted DNA binding CopG/RHH family protein
MNEQWRVIEEFPEYKISNLGNVCCIQSGRLFQLSKNKFNYSYVHIIPLGGNKPITKTVHRLVAKAFIPNPENKPHINHKNGIKCDNRAINLEWCTAKENRHHAEITGLHGRNIKLNLIHIRLESKDLDRIKKLADKKGLKYQQLIRVILREYLNQLDKKI